VAKPRGYDGKSKTDSAVAEPQYKERNNKAAGQTDSEYTAVQQQRQDSSSSASHAAASQALLLQPPGSDTHSAPTRQPSEREIAERAYHLWQQNGCPIGTAEQHWLDAERELRSHADPHSPVKQPPPSPSGSVQR